MHWGVASGAFRDTRAGSGKREAGSERRATTSSPARLLSASRFPPPASLLVLSRRHHATRDTRAGVAGGIRSLVVGSRVNYQRRPISIEQSNPRVGIQRHSRRCHIDDHLPSGVRHHVWQIAGVRSAGILETMRSVSGIQMWARCRELGRITSADLVEVDAVHAGRHTRERAVDADTRGASLEGQGPVPRTGRGPHLGSCRADDRRARQSALTRSH
jgi:hypothetical protein